MQDWLEVCLNILFEVLFIDDRQQEKGKKKNTPEESSRKIAHALEFVSIATCPITSTTCSLIFLAISLHRLKIKVEFFDEIVTSSKRSSLDLFRVMDSTSKVLL